MRTERIIDAMAGDERSKAELKLAYKKAFRVGTWVAIILSIITFLLLFVIFPARNFHDGSIIVARIIYAGFCILPPITVGAMVGSISLNFFTKHLKITLPETIAPRVEIKQK